MSGLGPIVTQPGSSLPWAVLREVDEWGLRSADVVSPPRRFWSDGDGPRATVEAGIDSRRLRSVPTPTELLTQLPEGDTWTGQSKRSIARLWAYFLLIEDPQRRLDARPVSTLSHQVSLVRHVLDSEALRRVLIADEVGLGKTVEAGLLIKELVERSSNLRVLYLAPARLVNNVRAEFDRLGLAFRQWTATDADARLTDPRILASIHRAVHGSNPRHFLEATPWDILVVDECHHLSDWAAGGGDPREKFKLVRDLIARLPDDGRVILLSGTPHQGHISRFENLLGLLRAHNEPDDALSGRLIYRTKDEVRDWNNKPLFSRRQVNEPIVVDLGPQYRAWIEDIHEYYRPAPSIGDSRPRQRAAGWRCAQALQWAASSPHAGLGYLVRQAMRGGWTLEDDLLGECLTAMRPYRNGPVDEPISRLFDRITREIGQQRAEADIEDIEDDQLEDSTTERDGLANLLREGLHLLQTASDEKWNTIWRQILESAGDEKVVLFAQPIETVTALAGFLTRATGHRPAVIIGGQSDAQRQTEVDAFRRPSGPRFLVSSRAGGEGINLQVARRLVHVDVPWNPMELEQRVGRVHRFGSRKTIIVDTLVVKDSREADAYRIAREKLRLIASTMVEPERFESVFSRVMCLMPTDDLQEILINEANAPFTTEDQERLASMVRQGFQTWRDFDRRFSDQQRQIRQLNPGLASWADVSNFVQRHANARVVDGYVSQRFDWKDGEIEPVDEGAEVYELVDGEHYACGDYQGAPVFGQQGATASQMGLNVGPISETIRSLAFPDQPTGAAHLRWPSGFDLPTCIVGETDFGVLVYLRQTIRTDQLAGWAESGSSLSFYVIGSTPDPIPVEGMDRRRLFDGLIAATIRLKPETDDQLSASLLSSDQSLWQVLRQPTATELESGIRHAVTPIFAALITVERS